MLPGETWSIYIHSSLPDDLGLQYQSYAKDHIVGEDEHLVIYPGLGHTVDIAGGIYIIRLGVTVPILC
jgi:hypothetical protein